MSSARLVLRLRGGVDELVLFSGSLSWLRLVGGFLVIGIEFVGLGEAVVEEGRGAGPLEAAQAPLAGLAGVGGEAGGAGGVIDAQVVFVPVAAVLAQPRMRFRRRKSTFAGRSASLRMR